LVRAPLYTHTLGRLHLVCNGEPGGGARERQQESQMRARYRVLSELMELLTKEMGVLVTPKRLLTWLSFRPFITTMIPRWW
jgi:hypothetical protein